MLLFRDNLTSLPFSVPILQTQLVSGGGPNLQNALNSFSGTPGTNLVITDSLAYDPIIIQNCTNLTISVATGQTPSITAISGTGSGLGSHCILFLAGISGVRISGLKLIGNNNANSGSSVAEGIVNGYNSLMTFIDRIIIEDCTFTELVPSNGAPGIQLIGTDGTVHKNVCVRRCIFTNCGSNVNTQPNGYGTCEISGFDGVYIQNCEITRDANLPRGSSNMRGFTWKSKNVIIEDCLVDDIGNANSNDNYKFHGEASFGTAVGSASLRNCVVHNGHRGYRIDCLGGTMTVTHSVVDNEISGIATGQTFIQQTNGSMTFRDSIIKGAGEGKAFDATVTEDHNDVFNVGSVGLVLSGSDFTIDPQFDNISFNQWDALATALQTGASDGGLIGPRYMGGDLIIWIGINTWLLGKSRVFRNNYILFDEDETPSKSIIVRTGRDRIFRCHYIFFDEDETPFAVRAKTAISSGKNPWQMYDDFIAMENEEALLLLVL